MKLVFLNPPRYVLEKGLFSMRVPLYRFERGVDLTHSTVASPTEMSYAAGYFHDRGYDVGIIDANAENLCVDEAKKRIVGEKPDLLIVRAGYPVISSDIEFVKWGMTEGFKSVLWENILNPYYSERIMSEYSIDYILCGEAETGLEKIIKGEAAVAVGEALSDSQMDYSPFTGGLDLERYRKRGVKSWYVFSQRGCNWGKCRFCLEGEKELRMRPLESVERELQMLEENGFQGVFFWGPEINPSMERAHELIEVIGNHDFTWECWLRADNIDWDLADKMRKAGCVKTAVGVETGCPQLLEKFDKNIEVGDVERTFGILRDADIKRQAFHVVGTPYDTVQGYEKTLELIHRINPELIVPTRYLPFPSTRMAQEAQSMGVLETGFYEACLKNLLLKDYFFFTPPAMTDRQFHKWVGVFRREESRRAFRTSILNPSYWRFGFKDMVSRTVFNKLS